MQTTFLSEQFRQFLAERPAISLGKLAKELNINRVNLQKIAKGYRNIPQDRRGDFLVMMEKYGFENRAFETIEVVEATKNR